MKLDEIAAPIENRHRDGLLVLLGPGGASVRQGTRACARDHLDFSSGGLLLAEREHRQSDSHPCTDQNGLLHLLLLLITAAARTRIAHDRPQSRRTAVRRHGRSSVPRILHRRAVSSTAWCLSLI